MNQQWSTRLLLAAALAAPASFLAVGCSGSVAGRAEGARANAEGPPPVTPDGKREEAPTLFPVWLDGKTGFIDRTGKLVIPPRFNYSQFRLSGNIFSDGMALISVEANEPLGGTNGHGTYRRKYGYINTTGEVVVEPRYWEAEDFSEGLAAVLMGDRWGYIDREGRTVLGPKWIAAESFSEGLAAVYEDGDRRGYIDKTGAMVLEVPYQGLGPFSEGMASVVDDELTQGFIDRAGRLVYKGESGSETKFSDGMAPVKVGDKWGYIDRTGRVAVEPVYDSAADFYNGQAVVGAGGAYWFIDKSGKKVGECLSRACNYREGLARVEVGGKWGYVDRAGRVVIKPKFDQAYDFSEGLAMVILPGKKMGYIDKTGKYVWKPTR